MNTGISTSSRNWIARSAAILLFISGIIHSLIIPQHWEHAPAHGISMAIIGFAEIVWAVLFWSKPNTRLAQFGIIIAVGCITLWGLTRILPAPFGHGPEEVDTAGIISKALEAFAALALIEVLAQTSPDPKNGYRVLKTVLALIILAVLLGFGVYGIARASEPLFPWLAVSETQEHKELNQEHSPTSGAPEDGRGSEVLPTP